MNHPLPPASPLASHWMLDPGVVFLNHGSFGACPREVLDAQDRLRHRMERQPLAFLARELERELDGARQCVGKLVGADPDDLVWVANATAGVNTVLSSLRFAPGDELLTTNQDYNACRNALKFAAERDGAHVVVAAVPFPVTSAEQIVAAVLASVTPHTRLALLDHVSSPTGVVFPIASIVRELANRGIATLIDGAHAPGMLPLDLRAIGATYYTGNLHKWVCAPKGAAFLHVARSAQREIRPLVKSHGANSTRSDRSRFRLEFDWIGTQDPTPWLCVASAIGVLASLGEGGLAGTMRRNHQLAVDARALLCARLKVAEPTPADLIGSLASIPLPDAPDHPTGEHPTYALQDDLLARAIEVPVVPWPRAPHRLLRISAQAYNSIEQYAYLADALSELLSREPTALAPRTQSDR